MRQRGRSCPAPADGLMAPLFQTERHLIRIAFARLDPRSRAHPSRRRAVSGFERRRLRHVVANGEVRGHARSIPVVGVETGESRSTGVAHRIVVAL
jgi:hypothetical protein